MVYGFAWTSRTALWKNLTFRTGDRSAEFPVWESCRSNRAAPAGSEKRPGDPKWATGAAEGFVLKSLTPS